MTYLRTVLARVDYRHGRSCMHLINDGSAFKLLHRVLCRGPLSLKRQVAILANRSSSTQVPRDMHPAVQPHIIVSIFGYTASKHSLARLDCFMLAQLTNKSQPSGRELPRRPLTLPAIATDEGSGLHQFRMMVANGKLYSEILLSPDSSQQERKKS